MTIPSGNITTPNRTLLYPGNVDEISVNLYPNNFFLKILIFFQTHSWPKDKYVFRYKQTWGCVSDVSAARQLLAERAVLDGIQEVLQATDTIASAETAIILYGQTLGQVSMSREIYGDRKIIISTVCGDRHEVMINPSELEHALNTAHYRVTDEIRNAVLGHIITTESYSVQFDTGSCADPTKVDNVFRALRYPEIFQQLKPRSNVSPLVVSDTDGNPAALLLAGFSAGCFTLSSKGIAALIRVCNEAGRLITKANQKNNHLPDSAERQNLTRQVQNVLKEMSPQENQAKKVRVIFLGDCINDRFDCSSVATEAKIIRILYNGGARFIRGNHDAADRGYTYASVSPSRAREEILSGARTREDKQFIHDTVFQYMSPACYDMQHNILFCHNGLSMTQKDCIRWGAKGADIPLSRLLDNNDENPGNALAFEMATHNALYDDKVPVLYKSEAKETPTNFRPTLEQIDEVAAQLKLTRIICGHNGKGVRQHGHAIQLNSVNGEFKGIINARTLDELLQSESVSDLSISDTATT